MLEPGAKSQRGFFGWFEADKPTATSADDAALIDAALALPEAACPPWPEHIAANCLVAKPLHLRADCWKRRSWIEMPFSSRHRATRNARTAGFYHFSPANGRHVVLKAKELEVLRPHGHLLRSGGSLTPDESALTSTAWMGGVFHSMVTQGHVSINRFLSTCHSYLGLFRSHGQRVFVEIDGSWKLLGIPSAFEMSPDSCRWIYKHRGGLIEVVSSAPDDRHELRLSLSVLEGAPARFLISHHVAINGDDGSASIPVVCEIGWKRGVCPRHSGQRCGPSLSRTEDSSSSPPTAHRSKRSAAMNCSSPTASPATSRFSVSSPHPPRQQASSSGANWSNRPSSQTGGLLEHHRLRICGSPRRRPARWLPPPNGRARFSRGSSTTRSSTTCPRAASNNTPAAAGAPAMSARGRWNCCSRSAASSRSAIC